MKAGDRHGWFTVIGESDKRACMLVQCDCGREMDVLKNVIKLNKYGCKNHIRPKADVMKAELICWSRDVLQIRNAHHVREFYYYVLKPYGLLRYGLFHFKILDSLSLKHYCVKIWSKHVDEPELSTIPNFYPRLGRYTTSYYRVETPETPDSLERKATAFKDLCKKRVEGDRRGWLSSGGVCHDGKDWIIFCRRTLQN